MAQFKSPGLEFKERFIGGSIRNRPKGRAGIVGSFEWGPVYSITTVTNRNDLIELFGEPTNENYNDFMNAYNYLQYANDLRVVRVINSETAKNSSAITNQIDFEITNGGEGYEIGDKFNIVHDTQVIDVGEVTKVDDKGAIKGVFIPSKKVIDFLFLHGQYPKLNDSWTIEFTNNASGNGAVIELKEVLYDSSITILNSDFALQSLEEEEFGAKCRKFGVPRISALYAGLKGDTIDVEIVSYDRFHAEQRGELTIIPSGKKRPMYAKDHFRYGPQTKDQYAIVVYVGGEKRETHIVSTNPNDVDKLSGKSIYIDAYFDVGSSEFITMIAKDFPVGFNGILSLKGGRSSTDTITAGDYIKGLDIIRDEETIRINTLIAGGVANRDPELATTVMKYASNIGEAKQNLVVVLDPLVSDVVGQTARMAVANMVKRRGDKDEANLNVNSTYTAFTGNWALQYDPYNNLNRWVSLSGDYAGLMAQVDNKAYTSQSPAGTEWGVIANKLKLAFNPNKQLRDQLTSVSINPVISFGEGSGFMFYADLTASYEQSHFDHINNRRVANMIKDHFVDLGLSVMFKNNTPYTRLNFKTVGEAYLKSISGTEIEFGRVWCDERNNPTDVQFRKEFVATVYYKPYNSINYVILNFVSVESGLQIEEDIVRADQISNFGG